MKLNLLMSAALKPVLMAPMILAPMILVPMIPGHSSMGCSIP